MPCYIAHRLLLLLLSLLLLEREREMLRRKMMRRTRDVRAAPEARMLGERERGAHFHFHAHFFPLEEPVSSCNHPRSQSAALAFLLSLSLSPLIRDDVSWGEREKQAACMHA